MGVKILVQVLQFFSSWGHRNRTNDSAWQTGIATDTGLGHLSRRLGLL